MTPRPRALAGAIATALPSRQQGFGLLGIIVTAALGATVAGVAYAMYAHARTSASAATAAAQARHLGERVRAAYAASGTFDMLSTTSAQRDGLYSSDMLRDGQPENPWGGSIQVAGFSNGFAVTYENVDPSACVPFVTGSAGGWRDIRVNGQSVMNGAAVATPSAVLLCGGAPASVQFIAARLAGATLQQCVPPPPETQPAACPVGEVSSIPPYSPDGMTRQREAVCLGAYGNAAWSPWAIVGNTCAPQCVPPSTTSMIQSGTGHCPAGQAAASGSTSFAQTRTATTSYTCSSPVGSVTSATSYGPWGPSSGSVCAPICSAPSSTSTTQYRWVNRSASCPAGQTGSHTWQAQQARKATTTYSCPAPTGAYTSNPRSYGAWADTGAKRSDKNTCAPAAVTCAFAPNSGWAFIQTSGVTSCQAGYKETCSDGSTKTPATVWISPGSAVTMPAENGSTVTVRCDQVQGKAIPSSW